MILYRKDVGTLKEKLLILRLLQDFQKYIGFVLPHSRFIPELLDLLRRTGTEEQFLLKFEYYLSSLKDYGSSVIGPRGSPLEHLSGEQYLCSMRFPANCSNVRILFAYQNDKVYLLLAFYERQGHRNTEYTAYTGPANERLQDMLREEEE